MNRRFILTCACGAHTQKSQNLIDLGIAWGEHLRRTGDQEIGHEATVVVQYEGTGW